MFGLDGGRRMFDQETSKPKKVSETLGRLHPVLQTLLARAAAHGRADRRQHLDAGHHARS